MDRHGHGGRDDDRLRRLSIACLFSRFWRDKPIGGWIVSTAGAVLIALMLSRQIPRTGGPYVYTHSAMGEVLGFMVGWGYWAAILTGGAAISVACIGYLGTFFPVLTSQPWISAIAALVIIWGLLLLLAGLPVYVYFKWTN